MMKLHGVAGNSQLELNPSVELTEMECYATDPGHELDSSFAAVTQLPLSIKHHMY